MLITRSLSQKQKVEKRTQAQAITDLHGLCLSVRPHSQGNTNLDSFHMM